MIVTVRGTSGSGKSTLVRRVMALYDTKVPVTAPGRKKPIAYLLTRGPHRLAVLGSYETTCGGCDTMSSSGMRDMVDAMVRKLHELGWDALFEGLILGGERHRMIKLASDGFPVRIVLLEVPELVYLVRVSNRRREKGNAAPLNPRNTVFKAEEVRRACRDCEAGGVPVARLDCEEAFEFVCGALGLRTEDECLI